MHRQLLLPQLHSLLVAVTSQCLVKTVVEVSGQGQPALSGSGCKVVVRAARGEEMRSTGAAGIIV